jgi:uncharacterized protein
VFVLDTNLLVYAVNRQAREHPAAREALERWLGGPQQGYLPWCVIYEFLRVTTHHRTFATPLTLPRSWDVIERFLTSRFLDVLAETPRHAAIMRDLTEAHPRVVGRHVHDLHIVALMKEHGINEIRTADAHFHQFTFLKVVNPLV